MRRRFQLAACISPVVAGSVHQRFVQRALLGRFESQLELGGGLLLSRALPGALGSTPWAGVADRLDLLQAYFCQAGISERVEREHGRAGTFVSLSRKKGWGR